MSKYTAYPYTNVATLDITKEVILIDHLNGFDLDKNNLILETLNNRARALGNICSVRYHNLIDEDVVKKYNNLSFVFDAKLQNSLNLSGLKTYKIHPEINFKNFVCSFNGSAHVSRRLLVSILQKFEYFNPEYCSKNFAYTSDILDGNVLDYTNNQHSVYRKFFISDNSEEFFQKTHSFGYVSLNYHKNIYDLEEKITQCFLHIVSETMATSYQPFVTEKFLYSVVTRGLFLAYAQPGWHDHVETYYGFKKYIKLFDYRFDVMQNPVERLIELMCMISKFSKLSTHEWHDLYLIEQDAIEYNYDHYFSGNYLTKLEQAT